jgi:hypothetical protein
VVDFDGDGDTDVVLASKRGDDTLFCNDRNDSDWLRVKLVGPSGDAGAFGAKLFVFEESRVDDPDYLRGFREARGATGYCSQNEPIFHCGLPGGRRSEVKAVFIDGTFYVVKNVEAPGVVFIDPAAPLR